MFRFILLGAFVVENNKYQEGVIDYVVITVLYFIYYGDGEQYVQFSLLEHDTIR